MYEAGKVGPQLSATGKHLCVQAGAGGPGRPVQPRGIHEHQAEPVSAPESLSTSVLSRASSGDVGDGMQSQGCHECVTICFC